jgi:hypothetical protein
MRNLILMARTGSSRDRAADDPQMTAADEVHTVVIIEAHSESQFGRRHLALLLAMLALLATVVVLARATGTATHGGIHGTVGNSPADNASWSHLALEEARERGPDPDHDTQ